MNSWRIITFLMVTFWCHYELAYCLSLVRPPLTSEELSFNEDQAIGGSVMKLLADVDCSSYVMKNLNYICSSRVNVMSEKLRYACMAPYTFTNHICSAENSNSFSEEVRQLLLTVRDRRRPNAKQGNSATASYPPGFMASRGRRDSANLLKQVDSAANFDQSIYASEISASNNH